MSAEAVPFWLVWREDGLAPRYKHQSPEAAEAEARRLAIAHPGDAYMVLAPVARVRMDALKVERFVCDDMVPF